VAMTAVVMAGCKSKNIADDAKIKIVCTIFPQYDFVRQLTKDMDNVEVSMLLKPGQESHDYDPSSKDILSIHEADLFIYVGGESDTWIKDVLSTVDNKAQKRIALMDAVELCAEEHDHEEHDHSHNGEEYDEHVWTSVANAITIVQKISEELNNIEETDKEKLRANTTSYIEELRKLDDDIKTVTGEAEKDTIIVADRFPLLYFCKEYGLNYHAAFSGCATSVEPSTATIIELASEVKKLGVKYIFAMEMSSKATAEQVANETGVQILTFYSGHNLTNDDFKAGTTYVDLMKKNMESLKKALN